MIMYSFFQEDMLAQLKIHIDQEQISWKAQIKSKDLELEALKEKLEKVSFLRSMIVIKIINLLSC